MRAYVIAGLQVLIGMIGIVLAFLVWASIVDGYPWSEEFAGLLLLAATPLVLTIAIRWLETGRRAGAVLALLCVFFGPTPMFMEATWLWSLLLGVPLAILWFQRGESSVPLPHSARDPS